MERGVSIYGDFDDITLNTNSDSIYFIYTWDIHNGITYKGIKNLYKKELLILLFY